MSFLSLLTTDGVGFTWLVEVSQDNFATTPYLWALNACVNGGNRYDGRIQSIGKLVRGFGLNNFPTPTSISLVLDNTDGGADWLVDVANGPNDLITRFRIKLALYPPDFKTGVEPTLQTMTVGTFGMLDSPMRDQKSVTLQLCDDSLGKFNELAASPSIRDWIVSADPGCPLVPGWAPSIDWDSPVPLIWAGGVWAGEGNVPAYFAATDVVVSVDSGHRPLMICATTSTAAAAFSDVLGITVTYGPDATITNRGSWGGANSSTSIPASYIVPPNNAFGQTPGTQTIWTTKKTATITKDGKSWKLLWVDFDINAYKAWFSYNFGAFEGGLQPDGSTTPIAQIAPIIYSDPPGNATYLHAFASVKVTGQSYSARTNVPAEQQIGLDVIQDLALYYAPGPSTSTVDAGSFTRARAVNTVPVQVTLQPFNRAESDLKIPTISLVNPASSGTLRQALIDLSASIGVDLFFTWAGLLGVSAGLWQFDTLTAARITLEETRAMSVKERKPSQGERWSYYNRLYVIGSDGVTRGPFDNAAAIAAVGARVARTVVGKYLLPDLNNDPTYEKTIWQIGQRIEAKQRNMISFGTDREALQLELGDLFNFTWTRGGTLTVFNGTVFQLEQFAIDPMTMHIDVEGVWVNDITTVFPYLLDDEVMTVRVASSGGRTATVQNSNTTVTFSAGSLITDGVAAGDILVLEDATQAKNIFTRFRSIRIASVTDALHLVVTSADLDFGSAGAVAVATWEIRRGATTYPNSSSDPTNYPSDGFVYGKACGATDHYSDSSLANELL